MRVQSFPTCCGAVVLTEFGYSETRRDDDGPPLEDIKAWVSGILSDPTYNNGYALATATLNTKQVRAGVSKVLLELGFKNVAEGHAPKHGNNVNLYAYIFNDTKRVD